MGEQEKDNREIEAASQENGSELGVETHCNASPRSSETAKEELTTPDNQQLETELISNLKSQIANLQKKAEANYNKFLRACADLENYKKRVEKEKGELINFSNERIIRDILPVIDNLERAVDHIEDESDLAAIKDGIKLVLDNMLAVLKKFGVEVASAMGEKFDPTRHEAVSQEETTECAPGAVIKEFNKCYYLNGRLIRPAMVVIAKPPETSPEMEEASGKTVISEQ